MTTPKRPCCTPTTSLSQIVAVMYGDFAVSGRTIGPTLAAYSQAMSTLTHLHETYFEDRATTVAGSFLWAASSWHGPNARQLKAELRTALRAHRSCPDR